MSEQLVSVIMPAFNREKYIAESIQSVLAQTYRKYELVIVDDGSTDRTAEVVHSFREHSIRYLYQSNSGPPGARNTGIRASKGDLIAFLDSDDLWMEQKLAVQVEAIGREGVDLLFGNGYVFPGDRTTDESVTFASLESHMKFGSITGDEMFNILFPCDSIPMLSVLARKASLERAGLFDESLSMGFEDYDLWLRLAFNGATFFGIEEPLVRYRQHPQGISKEGALRMVSGEIAVMEKHRHARNIAEHIRRERLRSLYARAITRWIENGMTGEARKYLARQVYREKFAPLPLAQALLIGLLPRKHVAIYRLLQRIKASASYRIGRLARSLLI